MFGPAAAPAERRQKPSVEPIMFYLTKNILFTLSCLWFLTACSEEATVPDPIVADRSPIELSVGGTNTVSIQKRAITQDPAVADRGHLPEGTALFMVMKSEKDAVAPLYAVTKGITDAPDAEKVNRVQFGEGYMRYWDDCYARDAKLSIYAACSPGSTKTITIGGRSDYQYTALPTTGAWSTTVNDLTVANVAVSTNQTATTLRDEDLCYSNNIANNAAPYGDGRLKFSNTLTGKFDHGRLAFYHALSKITFVVQRGKGFDESEFSFEPGTNIQLTDFYTNNSLFDIATGEFVGAYTSHVIQTMAQSGSAATGYTLEALVMPTTDLNTAVKGDIDFTIADNHYQLSKADLLEKITAADRTAHLTDGTRLKPGVNYVFTLIIAKTGIEHITATLLDWEQVGSEELYPSNAKVTLNLEDRSGTVTDADIYRLGETAANITDDITTEMGKGYVWPGTYEGPNRLTGTPRKLQTDWYWPNNKTFYHLRAIAPMGQTKATTGDGRDYVGLTHGETYTDITWGAPFKDIADSEKMAYTTTHGFDADDSHRIHPAIGATKDEIRLLMFHTMSDVSFDIYTSDGEDRVDLGDGTALNHTTITLQHIATTGKVFLGNGLVVADAPTTDYVFTALQAPDGTGHVKWQGYGAVPQALNDVVLVITTPDHNQYIVTMKEVRATSAISADNVLYPAYTDNKVDRWYPGVKYTYRFKLTKKGITDLKATILDWEEIEAGRDDVQIQ